jgi:hypothetical protein
MRGAAPLALLALSLGGCGGEKPPPPQPATKPQTGTFRFAAPPDVAFLPDGWLSVTVHVNRPLPGGDSGVRASIDVSYAHEDIPGLLPLEGTLRCYQQDLFFDESRGTLRDDQEVTLQLNIGGPQPQTLSARVPAHRVSRARSYADARRRAVARRLGCPPAPPETPCNDELLPTQQSPGQMWTEAAGGGATCRDARRVMRAVARWLDSRRCFQDLCVRAHRRNAGFRCAVAKWGEADWTITCRRGRQFVRGGTSE